MLGTSMTHLHNSSLHVWWIVLSATTVGCLAESNGPIDKLAIEAMPTRNETPQSSRNDQPMVEINGPTGLVEMGLVRPGETRSEGVSVLHNGTSRLRNGLLQRTCACALALAGSQTKSRRTVAFRSRFSIARAINRQTSYTPFRCRGTKGAIGCG